MINNHTDQVIRGEAYRVDWHHNDVLQRWDGNLATSGDVRDVIKSIKNKLSTDGLDREHATAMKKEHMDKISAWVKSDCPEIGSAMHFIYAVLTKEPVSNVHIDDEVKKRVTKHLEFLAFTSTAWILWTRYGLDGFSICSWLTLIMQSAELVKLKRKDIRMDKERVDDVLVKYMSGGQEALTIDDMTQECCEIHLRHRKGWQKKQDKSFREIDLHGKPQDFAGSTTLMYVS